jgi:ABC-2 type transport system ATP-binding protein
MAVAGRLPGRVSVHHMIKIQRLRKAYDDVIALRDIDLTIRKGAITGLLGPNGAGKTTLVSILTGILRKNDGKVIINGLDLDNDLGEIQSITGMVPQTLAIYPLLTSYENLEYFGALYGLRGSKLKERIDFSIEVASLQPFLHRRAGKCSGGMQRRLNLAIGMLNDPEILYLDEPTVGVDAQSRQYMLDMIRTINIERHTTIIYTSHYIAEIEQISDEIIIIDNGEIILNGKKDDILSASDTLAIRAKVPDAAIFEQIKSLAGVTIVADTIHIDRNEHLSNNIIQAITLLRDKNISITNIQFSGNRLEELYLRLTSASLRDDQ